MFEDNVLFTNTNAPDVIELKGISQSYDKGKTWILQDLNLLIEDNTTSGKFVVILGTSGCGKSTLLRYVSGLSTPTTGEVLINGKPITDKNLTGMVFQKYSSMPWLNVIDNVAFGLEIKGMPKKQRHEKAMEMIKLVGLDGQEKKFACELSGGQQQRVAIARSLLAAPEILLMDEPFGALDIGTRLKMQDLLCQIWSKIHTTVIFVTHDIPEAVYLGDEIFIMRSKPGKIVEKIDISALPTIRDRSIKRSPVFLDLVYKVEDYMMNIQNYVDSQESQPKPVEPSTKRTIVWFPWNDK